MKFELSFGSLKSEAERYLPTVGPLNENGFPDHEEGNFFLGQFFALRDGETPRLKRDAKTLLRKKRLSTIVNGVTITYQFYDNNLRYQFAPRQTQDIYCEMSHVPFERRRKYIIIQLIDALAEAETLAQFGYRPHSL